MRKMIFALLIFAAIGPMPGSAQHYPVDVIVDVVTAARIIAAPDHRPPAPGDHLRFVEGWHLTSRHSRFGGFSSLALLGPRRFQMMGDNGYWTRMTLGPAGRVSGLTMGRLPRPPEYPDRKGYADAESAIYDRATGKTWVGLEGVNQILRLDPALSRVEARRKSPWLDGWPENSGPEAMVRLADGRTLLVSEGADHDPRGVEVLVFSGDPAVWGAPPVRLFYDAQGKGQVSDAALLPDGHVLLVHRRLALSPLFTTILAVADPADLAPEKVWRSRTIGQVPEHLRENYEGVAVGVERGRVFVWLVSDHNFSSWQRTLLMKFELAGMPDSKKGGAVSSPP